MYRRLKYCTRLVKYHTNLQGERVLSVKMRPLRRAPRLVRRQKKRAQSTRGVEGVSHWRAALAQLRRAQPLAVLQSAEACAAHLRRISNPDATFLQSRAGLF